MQRHLALDIDRVEAIVDVANIVRERSGEDGRPADLARLSAVVGALADRLRDNDVLVYGLVDASLLTDRSLTPDERGELAAWAAEHRIEVVPDADPRILELAELLSIPVVSNDRFLDFYRTHTWIPGSRGRFLTHHHDPGGRVRVRPRVMDVPEEWRLSRKEEESLLKSARLYERETGRGRTDILTRRWLCPAEGCTWFGRKQTRNVRPVPVRKGSDVVCPDHGLRLRDAGPRPACVQMKVVVDGRVRSRFLVDEGQEVLVGRAPSGPRVCRLEPWLDAATAAWTSRTHLSLRLDARGGLVVRDRSTNGTRVRDTRPDGRVEWLRGTSRTLRPRDVVVVHERVVLERSGRVFAFEASEPTTPGRAAAREAPVTMVVHPPPSPAGRGGGSGGGRRAGRGNEPAPKRQRRR